MKIASDKKRGRPKKDPGMLPGSPAVAPEQPAMKDAMAAKDKEPDEYEKESWARTLMEAHDIKNDPEKMKHAMAHMDVKMGKMKSIQDLKDYAQAKYGKKEKQ